ncbi:MAG: DUF4136 domain-containing protein [Vicinamibacterales bacterium]
MRTIHRTLTLALAAAAVVAAGCAPVRVNASLERGMAFTNYSSYTWADDSQFSTGDPRLDNNEFFQHRLQGNVDAVLEQRGLEKVSATNADLVIHYHANISQRIDVNALDRSFGYCQDCHSSIYDAGTITLDFIDAKTNTLVWRGWSEGSLDGIDSQPMIESRLDESVRKILLQLPPRL